MTKQMKQSLKDRVGYIADACKLGIGGDIAQELEAIVNWYRNNVWHDASEEPIVGRKVIWLTENDCIQMCTHKANLVYGGLTKWAYLEDLIPDEI